MFVRGRGQIINRKKLPKGCGEENIKLLSTTEIGTTKSRLMSAIVSESLDDFFHGGRTHL